jgi:thiosulfate/3-mercaptopyruvate sulfurtransferase
MHRTLIDCDTLAKHLGAPDWRVFDCRFDLGKPELGGAQYWQGHVPGAIYAHLDRDLSAPVTPSSGRHPLPDPAMLAARCAGWGITARTQVVAYDQGNGMYASRLWWLLRWLGHERVAVLNGGLAEWRKVPSRPVSRDVVTLVAGSFAARLRKDWVVSTEQLAPLVEAGLSGQVLCDARGADRFAGQNETIDPVAGHVPGASNMPFAANLGPDGRFLSPAQLRERWAQKLMDPSRTIMMCGSGVSACHNLLALEHAGLPGARLYGGSWSEWIRDPARPVAIGSE